MSQHRQRESKKRIKMGQKIEVKTISKDGKKLLIAVLKKAIQVEYDLIFNYPRVIDSFIKFDKINDERFLSDVETIGKDSLRHLNWDVDIIESLGGEYDWNINAVERYYDVNERRGQQLEKEKAAAELYKQAIRLVRENIVKEKVEDISGKLINTGRRGLREEVRKASELVGILERIELEEEKHVRMIQDLLATYDFLMGGES
ncbi:MAG: hypothetical protein V3V52_06960 [Candidatus Adiutricales bacterium]